MQKLGLAAKGAVVMLAALCALAPAQSAYAAEQPKKVVSMNLCTDQLALLLADKGQLYSVSHLATDLEGSVLAKEAKAYVTNHGLADSI